MAGRIKKKSVVALRTLYPCDFNTKNEKVREFIAVIKDFKVFPTENMTKYIEGYVSKFSATRSVVADLLANPGKYHEFTKRDETFGLQITKVADEYLVHVSKKTTGYVYGFSFTDRQLICKFESIVAPSQMFNTEANIYQVIFNNPIEELKARFAQ